MFHKAAFVMFSFSWSVHGLLISIIDPWFALLYTSLMTFSCFFPSSFFLSYKRKLGLDVVNEILDDVGRSLARTGKLTKGLIAMS